MQRSLLFCGLSPVAIKGGGYCKSVVQFVSIAANGELTAIVLKLSLVTEETLVRRIWFDESENYNRNNNCLALLR